MATPGFNIMYEKKISYFQDEVDEQFQQHATFPCHAFPSTPHSTFHDNLVQNSYRLKSEPKYHSVHSDTTIPLQA